jgi:hypothetical protein
MNEDIKIAKALATAFYEGKFGEGTKQVASEADANWSNFIE